LYRAEDEGVWLFIALNGFIHTFMYAYYTAALLKIRIPGKNFITIAQLTQFFVGFYFYWQYSYIPECHEGPRLFTFWYTYSYVGILVLMFAHFYYKTYGTKKTVDAVGDKKKEEEIVYDNDKAAGVRSSSRKRVQAKLD